MEQSLGKITNFKLGTRESRFGAHFTLETTTGATQSSECFWSPSEIKISEYTKWTEEDRDKEMVKFLRWLNKLMHDAKATDINQMVGKPIEVTWNNNMLSSWRILTEVL